MGEAKQRERAIEAGEVEACGNCRFFKRAGNTAGGWCRVRAPVVLLVGMVHRPVTNEPVPVVNSYHPQMPIDGWCGEHAAGKPAVLSALDLSQLRLSTEPAEGTA